MKEITSTKLADEFLRIVGHYASPEVGSRYMNISTEYEEKKS
jgi:hypothetical protein